MCYSIECFRTYEGDNKTDYDFAFYGLKFGASALLVG